MSPHHPYAAYEGTPIWLAVDAALRDLEANRDVRITAARPYVLGYLARAAAEVDRAALPPPADPACEDAEAWAIIQRIADPVVRNLVQIAFAAARLRVTRRVGETESEWRSRLPAGGTDMVLFVEAVLDAFRDKGLVRALLDGRSIEEAAGWDG
jgi:hypothetical protein